METGDTTGAVSCFKASLQIDPDFAEAHLNLGLLLDRQGDKDAAEICYRRSLALNPAYFETCLNLAVLLAGKKQFDEAELLYRQAIALRPHSPVAWSNLGVLYACIKRENNAEQCCRTALFIDDSYAAARFNLSYLLLRQGRLEEGWQYLESRKGYAVLDVACPRWQGESLAGMSILIGYEAGHGDMIQFCRYASVLKKQGAVFVALICHPALKTLFAQLEGVDAVISLDEHIPQSAWDFWIPLMSIPYYCNTRLNTIPDRLPYLNVPVNRVRKWAVMLPKDGFRVGLVWKGNPLFENDAERSLPSIDVLAPLWTVSGVSYISLQKGIDEIGAAHLINIAPRLTDFADTAALVMNLDLVICVDTAVAHLAGALGKACWVLLPEYKTDWRWLTDRTDTPWYPEIMRLFRQPEAGDWNSVVDEVVIALKRRLQDLD